MSMTGTVKSFNPHKGWGFVECNGTDVFLNKKELKGFSVKQGSQVQFTLQQVEKGSQATNVTVIGAAEEAQYLGEIKSFNQGKGYGFITCEAFPGQDIFVLKTELPGGFGPTGGQCRFKVGVQEKGKQAKEVQLLGAAGNQVQAMKQMGMMGGMDMMGGMGMMGKGMMGGGMMGGKGGGGGVWKPMFQKAGKGGKSDDMTCWDLKKTGMCPRGAACKFQH
ncbi:unnamed protein product [Polarella glacialis]|uniref:C3H1-type domain-containing protein n=1 Tax=Polarella glacialis TaxID=89957 RepID=A0A813GEF1_POLGL|nr:unnamed protein product [Polarella glacialis]